MKYHVWEHPRSYKTVVYEDSFPFLPISRPSLSLTHPSQNRCAAKDCGTSGRLDCSWLHGLLYAIITSPPPPAPV